MKKQAVVNKFAEALAHVPAELVPKVAEALSLYESGDSDGADAVLAEILTAGTVKRRVRTKKKRLYPGSDPMYVDHNLVDDSTADAIDTNFREFD